MITPTIGRIVWYRQGATEALASIGNQPLAAIVTGVWNDRLVNLAVFDANGNHHNRTSVLLVQEGDEVPGSRYCEWMPYQKAQAAKS